LLVENLVDAVDFMCSGGGFNSNIGMHFQKSTQIEKEQKKSDELFMVHKHTQQISKFII
jgi:hypothetical protein